MYYLFLCALITVIFILMKEGFIYEKNQNSRRASTIYSSNY
ncbi:hypothetical protein CNEO3_1290003 [Clostridium neonatale]|nr:hypothetical protein CNEO3_1200006 [Clostridium neonatale]CAI3572427.1 hypothetical protein CNEO3_1290003 [Clostridium neonatale]CAI3573066.1 hypothetical protein CNEO3_1280003 [Clostridium neonatale]CAI3631799.1 hypothetical protein CNEO3_1250006 [Clostridium neonatale]